MSNAEQYLNRLKEFSHIEIAADTVPEAKAALAQIRLYQKQLRQLKREINVEMREIRAEYAARAESAGSGGGLFFTVFGMRGAAKSHQASAKRSLRAERDGVLKPYESMKTTIDDLLLQMDKAKLQIQAFLDEQKNQ